jgi:hypothetical protein
MVKELMLGGRVGYGIPFTDLLPQPLSFKIPVVIPNTVTQFPEIFQYGVAEYGASMDAWLDHSLLSLTSEQAVVILDGMWQNVVQKIARVVVYLDEHDASSGKKLRPDFAAMFGNCLVMKGEAKASRADMMVSSNDLIKKFHKLAYKLFPKGCNSIPAVTTCNEEICLYSISYNNNRFYKRCVKQYDVTELRGRVDFVVDLFKLIIWILSQTEPTEGLHLIPDVRTKTRNGHHITLLQNGLLKEFDKNKVANIKMNIIGSIYEAKLPNVEHGTVNCTSVTITRVGSRLRDAMRVRSSLDFTRVFNQVQQAIEQLHAIGYAHCDICVDNIFVDSEDEGGAVFLGDLEYCCRIQDKPPTGIRRADSKAKTAQQLDKIQLQKLQDEIASILAGTIL